MIRQVGYERVATYFRKLTWLALGIAVLGALAGLVFRGTEARAFVWIIAGILAAGTLAISLIESRRYQRAAELASGSREMPQELSMDDPDAQRKAALARYQRSFGRLAGFCLLVAVAGFIIGPLLSGLARALVIAMVGFGGLLVAWMAMVIRKRIRTGPKMQ
jgi:hypothetical protein